MMTSEVLLCRKAPVKFEPRSFKTFFGYISIETDILAPEMINESAKWESIRKNNECMKLFDFGVLSVEYFNDSRALSMNQFLNFTW